MELYVIIQYPWNWRENHIGQVWGWWCFKDECWEIKTYVQKMMTKEIRMLWLISESTTREWTRNECTCRNSYWVRGNFEIVWPYAI